MALKKLKNNFDPKDAFHVPAFCRVSAEDRAKSWEQTPPEPFQLLEVKPEREMDPTTVAFLREQEQRDAAKKVAKVARLKRIVPKVDQGKVRWDPSKNKWVLIEFTRTGKPVIASTSAKPSSRKQSAASRKQETDMAKAAKKKVTAKKKKAGAKKVVTKAAKAKKAAGNGESTGRAVRVIRLKAGANPYKEGSKGAEHFEAMKGGVTVAQYLDKFENRKNASQWLGNAIADEHAELLG